MKLKLKYEAVDDIPEQFRELYSEADGEFTLTGIDGMKTQADIDRIHSALTKERADHKATKERYSALSSYDIDDIISKLDKYDELEALASGNAKDADKLVEARINSVTAPLKREIDKLSKSVLEKDNLIEELKTREKSSKIEKAISAVFDKFKVKSQHRNIALEYAERRFDVDDAGNVVTRDGYGIMPGISPEVWLTDIREQVPDWFEETVGAGSKGSNAGGFGGTNPFQKGPNWNETVQAKIFKENPEKARQMAKLAGVNFTF